MLIVLLFAASLLLRYNVSNHLPSAASLIVELVGGILALGTAWLGGELVDRLGVGVDPGANLNASNSLSGEPAYQEATPETPPEKAPRATMH